MILAIVQICLIVFFITHFYATYKIHKNLTLKGKCYLSSFTIFNKWFNYFFRKAHEEALMNVSRAYVSIFLLRFDFAQRDTKRISTAIPFI